MKQIPVATRKNTKEYILVDDEDYEYLNQWCWMKSHGYAFRMKYMKNTGGKYKNILMHRIINNTPDGFFTDHINRNKLDNRKCNLRTATSSQNKFNTGLSKSNRSGYKGIIWNSKRKKWQATITVHNKTLNLGRYNILGGAFLVRKWSERLYFGDWRKK